MHVCCTVWELLLGQIEPMHGGRQKDKSNKSHNLAFHSFRNKPVNSKELQYSTGKSQYKPERKGHSYSHSSHPEGQRFLYITTYRTLLINTCLIMLNSILHLLHFFCGQSFLWQLSKCVTKSCRWTQRGNLQLPSGEEHPRFAKYVILVLHKYEAGFVQSKKCNQRASISTHILYLQPAP
jgi:hypothetical protein